MRLRRLTRSHHAFTLIEVMSNTRSQHYATVGLAAAWIMLAEVPI